MKKKSLKYCHKLGQLTRKKQDFSLISYPVFDFVPYVWVLSRINDYSKESILYSLGDFFNFNYDKICPVRITAYELHHTKYSFK